ncbi:MAG: hypothetical protein KJ749_14370 [Planctomycetes bacterium]|nr:hypothetical protein [Planctomycetota bacterium]
MTTNTRGRSGWGTRSTWNKGTTGGKRTTGTGTYKGTTMNVPPKYKGVYDCFNWKISSYRTLWNQARGPAKYTRPTPATLNTFATWVDKGAMIQVCSRNQLAKWARTTKVNYNPQSATTTTCRNVLNKKFGRNTIKAVARTKTGSYMVATTPTWKGKPFQFPK